MTHGSSDTLIPGTLIPEIEAAAREEQRAPQELVREAIERHLSERQWLRKDEAHAKIAAGIRSLQSSHGLDGEATMAALLAEIEGN